ncbi:MULTISPECIES: hypothetical protein [unclassified Aeromonas]|uniref:hypothetical protein n=1 Tax=unclassified Aeromonas TaxID=257493 RepID=UPI0022E76ECA|nr:MULTISPECIES: hypothetical protein [unclassified Aeromonas]
MNNVQLKLITFNSVRYARDVPAAQFAVIEDGVEVDRLWMDADDIQANADAVNQSFDELSKGMARYGRVLQRSKGEQ